LPLRLLDTGKSAVMVLFVLAGQVFFILVLIVSSCPDTCSTAILAVLSFHGLEARDTLSICSQPWVNLFVFISFVGISGIYC